MWNNILLKPPPTNSYRGDAKSVETSTLKTSLKTFLWKTNVCTSALHLDATLLSRMLHRLKKKFRGDIGLKYMEKINKALHRYLNLDLVKDINWFMESIPMEKSGDVYFPTKQMLEYVMVRMQGFAKVMGRIIENCADTACFMVNRLKLGHFWNIALLIMAIVSRIWRICQHVVELACKCYQVMLQVRDQLKLFGVEWLEAGYEFPADLRKWLNLPWAKEDLQMLVQKQLELPTYIVSDDEDDDIQFCFQYKNDYIVIDDMEKINDDDVQFVNEYIEIIERNDKRINKNVKDTKTTESVIEIESDSREYPNFSPKRGGNHYIDYDDLKINSPIYEFVDNRQGGSSDIEIVEDEVNHNLKNTTRVSKTDTFKVDNSDIEILEEKTVDRNNSDIEILEVRNVGGHNNEVEIVGDYCKSLFNQDDIGEKVTRKKKGRRNQQSVREKAIQNNIFDTLFKRKSSEVIDISTPKRRRVSKNDKEIDSRDPIVDSPELSMTSSNKRKKQKRSKKNKSDIVDLVSVYEPSNQSVVPAMSQGNTSTDQSMQISPLVHSTPISKRNISKNSDNSLSITVSISSSPDEIPSPKQNKNKSLYYIPDTDEALAGSSTETIPTRKKRKKSSTKLIPSSPKTSQKSDSDIESTFSFLEQTVVSNSSTDNTITPTKFKNSMSENKQKTKKQKNQSDHCLDNVQTVKELKSFLTKEKNYRANNDPKRISSRLNKKKWGLLIRSIEGIFTARKSMNQEKKEAVKLATDLIRYYIAP